jgi:hypothetical protein
VVTALPSRPEPPPELDCAEQRIWQQIVGALPATWLDTAAQELLVRAVAQLAVCEHLEAQLRSARAAPNPDAEAMAALAAQHVVIARSVTNLLGALRAHPRSRIRPVSAARQAGAMPKVRPWQADDA